MASIGGTTVYPDVSLRVIRRRNYNVFEVNKYGAPVAGPLISNSMVYEGIITNASFWREIFFS